MLKRSILSNSESWINLIQKDIDTLEEPDTMLQRNILSLYGNPSKVFMHLELGIIPVRFVIMEKRLNFLKYLLNQNMNSMIRQVYEVLKTESRKGGFYHLAQQDMSDLKISVPKLHWKK